jgi:hypothetical protein
MSAARAKLLDGSGVVGVFAYVDVAVEAVRRLRERGWDAVRVYAPVPSHALLAEADAGAKASPMRAFALIGGITGTIAGFALASFAGMKMHTYQGLLVGGKPPVSIPAYLIIGFELTVLIGALATMAGFLINARLPKFRRPVGYDEKFSDDRFGVFVPCDAEYVEAVTELLSAAGAEEVRRCSAEL